MQKNPRWKQPTPAMEHVCIVSSLEGHYSNWEDGVIGNLLFSIECKHNIDMLKALQPFLEKGSW